MRKVPPFTQRFADSSELSFAEQRLWALEQVTPGTALFHVHAALRIEGELDPARLAAAVRVTVARHPVLASVYTETSGGPRREYRPFTLEIAAQASGGDLAAAVRDCIAREDARPFDLARGPLVRACLLVASSTCHVLVLVLHHLVCDESSLNAIAREVADRYDDREPAGAAPDYGELVAWQRAAEQADGERDLAYWRAQLAGAPGPIALLPARPRCETLDHAGGNHAVRLSRDLSDGLRRMARDGRTSVFCTYVAAVQAFVAVQTGERDIVLGSVVSPRTDERWMELVGLLVDMVALRTRVERDASFRSVISGARTTLLDALDHVSVPYDRWVPARESRTAGRDPLLGIVVVMETPAPPIRTRGGLELRWETLPSDAVSTSKFDLTIVVRDLGSEFALVWQYRRSIYAADEIACLVEHFTRFLASLLSRPDAPLATHRLSSSAELARLRSWSVAPDQVPDQRCIDRVFADVAARWPDAPAVVCGRDTLTYRELDRRASALARVLIAEGVAPESPVGVCAGRSMEFVIAILAILKAGAAYLPLDPSHPVERARLLCSDARVERVLAQPAYVDRFDGFAVTTLRAEPPAPDLAVARREPSSVRSSQALAYVMYTSGTTGRPKGIAIPHVGVVRLALDPRWHVRPGDRFLQLASLAFDASTLEIWGALLNGACLVLAPPQLPSLHEVTAVLTEHAVSHLLITPSLFNALVDADGLPASLRYCFVGGEAMSSVHVARARSAWSGTLCNAYGPTECSAVSTLHVVTANDELQVAVPIGTPIACAETYVLDDELQVASIGTPGELYIGGALLARGYHQAPGLTAERFVPHVEADQPGARLYRTGDRCAYLPSGELVFLGRTDRQIKLRGNRIEPVEIEAALTSLPGVLQAHVTLTAEDHPRLVGYVVCSESISGAELRDALARLLPAPLVPSTITALDAFPVGPTGKLDTRALPAPEVPATTGEPPRGDLEAAVAAIWNDILPGRATDRDADFFALGGNSLIATKLVAKIRSRLSVSMTPRAVFDHPTIAQLARAVEQAPSVESTTFAPAARGVDVPLSFEQERMCQLAMRQPASTLFNSVLPLRLEGPLDLRALREALDAMVRRHEILRTSYHECNGRPTQRISPPVSVPFELVWSDPARYEEAVREAIRHESETPVALARVPMLRARVVCVGEQARQSTLILTFHHIVIDDYTVALVGSELGALYEAALRGTTTELPDPRLQFAEFAARQRQRLTEDVLDAELRIWCKVLTGVRFDSDPPADIVAPDPPTYRSASVRTHVPESVARPLRAAWAVARVTSFMGLLAAYDVLLMAESGSSDICVESPTANRDQESADLVGYLVNPVLLRVDCSGNPTWRELVTRVRGTCLDAFAHQELPFARVAEAVARTRDVYRFPIAKIVMTTPGAAPSLPGLRVNIIDCEYESQLKNRYLLWAREAAGGFDLKLQFNTDAITASHARGAVRALEAILARVAVDGGVTAVELVALARNALLEPIPGRAGAA